MSRGERIKNPIVPPPPVWFRGRGSTVESLTRDTREKIDFVVAISADERAACNGGKRPKLQPSRCGVGP